MTIRTPYEILGCDRQLPTAEIRRAYLRLARIYHPDYYAAATLEKQRSAENMMQTVNGAWHTLQDPARRRRYDLFGPKHIGSAHLPESETVAPDTDVPKRLGVSENHHVGPLVMRVPVGLLAAGILLLTVGFVFDRRMPRMEALVIVGAAGIVFSTAFIFAMAKSKRDSNYR